MFKSIFGTRRNEILYFIYFTFQNFAFPRAIFILFLLQRGMSNPQIGTLQSILFISTILLEIPTGLLADRYGRKIILLVGGFLSIAHAVSMVFLEGFFVYSILFALYGASAAFVSGSDSALLYDYMKSEGRQLDYLKVSSRAYSSGQIALGIAMCLGGFLQSISWDLVYMTYAFCLTLSWIATWYMTEPKNITVNLIGKDQQLNSKLEPVGKERTILSLIKTLFSDTTGRLLFLFVFAYGIFEGVMTPLYIYGQYLFTDFGWNEKHLGFLFASI